MSKGKITNKIMNFIKENQGVSTNEIRNETGFEIETITSIVSKKKANGDIEQRKDGKYYIDKNEYPHLKKFQQLVYSGGKNNNK